MRSRDVVKAVCHGTQYMIIGVEGQDKEALKKYSRDNEERMSRLDEETFEMISIMSNNK